MKTAKIKKVTIESWDSQYGKMYSHKMELDNWETIKINKKKDNSFKAGDSISYEENWDGKWKEVKEENNFKAKSNSDTNIWAMIGMSFKLAFEHLYDKSNYNETYNLAVRIFEDAMNLFNNYGRNNWTTDTKPESESENDDLPF